MERHLTFLPVGQLHPGDVVDLAVQLQPRLQLFGRDDDPGNSGDCRYCLARFDVVAGALRVFDLRSPTAQRTEGVKRSAELGAYDLLDRDVVPGAFRA